MLNSFQIVIPDLNVNLSEAIIKEFLVEKDLVDHRKEIEKLMVEATGHLYNLSVDADPNFPMYDRASDSKLISFMTRNLLTAKCLLEMSPLKYFHESFRGSSSQLIRSANALANIKTHKDTFYWLHPDLVPITPLIMNMAVDLGGSLNMESEIVSKGALYALKRKWELTTKASKRIGSPLMFSKHKASAQAPA